jgi:hypothetical protein
VLQLAGAKRSEGSRLFEKLKEIYGDYDQLQVNHQQTSLAYLYDYRCQKSYKDSHFKDKL